MINRLAIPSPVTCVLGIFHLIAICLDFREFREILGAFHPWDYFFNLAPFMLSAQPNQTYSRSIHLGIANSEVF